MSDNYHPVSLLCVISKVFESIMYSRMILGPLLFLVYINDLWNIYKSALPILFANDTNLFKSSQDISIIGS